MPRARGPLSPLLALLVAAHLPAQEPRVEVAFAAGAAGYGPPAVAWLCDALLPERAEWPDDLPAGASFAVRLDDRGLAVTPNTVPLPEGAVLAGAVELGDGVRMLCVCMADGVEDWYLSTPAAVPRRHARALHALRATDLERARTIDLAVAVGHFLGATVPGDRTRDAVLLGAGLCGEVTWQAWRTDEHVRVRGRSDGGLLLPAVLLALAERLGNGVTAPLPLRAFVARDGEREEALRQMSRSGGSADRETLLAMLHSSDEMRLTAIDSLVRLRASDTLPRIVAAAAPQLPLTTIAATDAIAALWSDASAATRRETREALHASTTPLLRAIDPEKLAAPVAERATATTLRRLLLWLLAIGAGLFPLWLRERARAKAFA